MLLSASPPAQELLADRGYDSNRVRAALRERGIAACIPSTKSRKTPLPYDKELYRQRHRIENMFGRLKDWRRIATRYDRCAHAFFSAICIAATLTYWL
jgi:transposase